jgi:hypothetical protein
MKTKLAVLVLIVLSSAGCVTGTNSYSRDIVYRDGSYYSPADEQYGDYYYEPEPDYSSYYDDDYYYGFNSGYYSRHDSYRCRFSYRHDRYCNNGWGSSYLNFGGLTIIFGNSNYYGYGHGYSGYGYGYGYHGNHGYHGAYPYYGWYSPRPQQPRNNDPIPMPKPPRPLNPTPDYSLNNAPGMRVSGEPIRMPTKPGVLIQTPSEPSLGQQGEQNPNPYLRTRDSRRPNIRPENWRNDDNRSADNPYAPRMRTKPALIVEASVVEDRGYESSEKPIRQNRRPQPYLREAGASNERQPPVIDYSSSDGAPVERVRIDNNRQERQAPRIQARERIERVEPAEPRVQPARVERQESNDDGNGAN